MARRRRYKSYNRSYRRRRNNGLFSLSKNERILFNFLIELIKTMIFIVTGICKITWNISCYLRKRLDNHYALIKIGYSLDEIFNLINNKFTPRQFEFFCAELFKSTGLYSKVEITEATNDYGKDCILTRNINGIKEVTFVECKHWRKDDNSKIGREICQKLLGSVQMHRANKAIVITTGLYHKNAYEAASMVSNLVLMDNMDIQKMILNLDENQMSRVMAKTLNAD